MSLQLPHLEAMTEGWGVRYRKFYAAEDGWEFPREERIPALQAILGAKTIAEQKRAITAAVFATALHQSLYTRGQIEALGDYSAKADFRHGPDGDQLTAYMQPLEKGGVPAEIVQIKHYTKGNNRVDARYHTSLLALQQQEFARILGSRFQLETYPEGTEAVTGPAVDLGRVVVDVLTGRLEWADRGFPIRSALGLETPADVPVSG